MKELLRYLNPLARMGVNKYSIFFPLIFSILVCILSEVFAYGIAKNPEIVGVYIIFINVATIIYFAFRDGIRAGFISSIIPILYYFYIIDTREYSGDRFIASVETTIILAILYFLLGGVIGWLKQTIDNLIQREAYERRRLEAIVEQLPVGVIITDSQARVVKTNKQLENILGVEIPKGFILGKDAPIVNGKYNNHDITPSHSPLVQALGTGRTVKGREFIVSKKDGKQIFLQVSASPIRNDQGKIIAGTSIITDITPQKEMENRKDEFINMASHELKTPITSIKLYIDSLIDRVKKFDDEKVSKSLKSVKYQVEKLQELASDLLDVSRIQTGKLSFNKEEFRIGDLVEEAISELQTITKAHQIKLAAKDKISIFADRFRISQVLTNLLSNAIKYSPEGGDINIEIKKRGKKVLVSIKDSGIGIAKEEHSKIFNRLYQVIDSQVKTFPGLGMGLYISREIIKRHKGRIWVESKKGSGSTFLFELPIKI